MIYKMFEARVHYVENECKAQDDPKEAISMIKDLIEQVGNLEEQNDQENWHPQLKKLHEIVVESENVSY